MRMALLTSTHLRHQFMARYLARHSDLRLVVAEEKGNEQQYKAGAEEDTMLLCDHFRSLEDAERRHFRDGVDYPDGIEIVRIPRGQVNSDRIAGRLRANAVEGIAVFGPGLLAPHIFELCPGNVVNAHQGLSPYYRGSATNFWPFVNERLELVGVTMHYIDAGIDTGDIICHGMPNIEEQDSMHDIGCKVVHKSAELFVSIFDLIETGRRPSGISQWDKGQLFRRKDFNAEAVRAARRNMEQRLVPRFLEGKKRGDIFGVRVVELR